MINYTTPTYPITVEDKDLTGQDVYVTFEQMGKKLTKSGADLTITTETHDQVTDTIITTTFTQEETAMFDPGTRVKLQVNFINSEGVRDATNKATIEVFSNLLDKVIAYGDPS